MYLPRLAYRRQHAGRDIMSLLRRALRALRGARCYVSRRSRRDYGCVWSSGGYAGTNYADGVGLCSRADDRSRGS